MRYPCYDTAAKQDEQLKAEIAQDLEAYNLYVAEHGSPAELARNHYAADDDAV